MFNLEPIADDALVARLGANIIQLSRIHEGNQILISGSNPDGVTLLADLLARLYERQHRKVRIVRSRHEFFSLLGLNESDWEHNFNRRYADSADVGILVLEDCSSGDELLPIARVLDSIGGFSKPIVCITSRNKDDIAPFSAEINLKDYKVDSREAHRISSGLLPDIPLTSDFMKSVLPFPLPIPVFLSWFSHFRRVLEVSRNLGLIDVLNPENAAKSLAYRPKPNDNPNLFESRIIVNQWNSIRVLMEKLSSSCVVSLKPFHSISEESYYSLGLTAINGRDPLGMAELALSAAECGLIYIDDSSKCVFPIADFLRFDNLTWNPLDVDAQVDQKLLAYVANEYSEGNTGTLTTLLDALPSIESAKRFRETLLRFANLDADTQSVLVLESLRRVQKNMDPLLDQTPHSFLTEMDPSNSEKLKRIHSITKFENWAPLLGVLPLSRSVQKAHKPYFANLYRRFRGRTAGSGNDLRSGLKSLSMFGFYDCIFGEVPDFSSDLAKMIEHRLLKFEDEVDGLDYEDAQRFSSLLCSEYVRLILRLPEAGHDSLFAWLRADLELANRLGELKAIPSDFSGSSIDGITKLWIESKELILHSELFVDRILAKEKEASMSLLGRYRTGHIGKSIADVKRVIGWLLDREDAPPPGFDEMPKELAEWKKKRNEPRAIFLFIVDGLSYRHLSNWLQHTNPSESARFRRILPYTVPVFSPPPTLTSQGHVTIVSGEYPSSHGIFDSKVIIPDEKTPYKADVREVNKEVSPDDLNIDKSKLAGAYFGGLAESYLLNSFLEEKNIPPKGLSAVLGYKMRVLDKMNSKPALYSKLDELPLSSAKTTVYLVQIPDLDEYSHDEGVERPGSPQDTMSRQISTQYERLFTLLLGKLETIRGNAMSRRVSVVFLLCADHGMDFCTRTVSAHYEILHSLGLETKRSPIADDGSDPSCYPSGIYPRKLLRGIPTREERLGCASPGNLKGKIATVYLFYDPKKLAMLHGSCGCGPFVTTIPTTDVKDFTCPDCGEECTIEKTTPLSDRVNEILQEREFDGFNVVDCEYLNLQSEKRLNSRVYPLFFMLSHPGHYLVPGWEPNTQQVYETLRPHLDFGEPKEIGQVVSKVAESKEDRKIVLKNIRTLLDYGYLMGIRINGFEEVIPGVTHISPRKSPLVGVLSHGSASISECYVPFLAGAWCNNES